MQQGSTILQHLTLRSNISLSDPATPHGKLWNSALKSVTKSQGWSQLHWGPELASKIVDLIITWRSHADLQYFMTHSYRPFLSTIEPLLSLDDGAFQSVPPPYILQLHPGMPSLELDAVSSLYELSFESQPDPDLKTGLGIETQLCRSFLLDASQGISDGDLFLGMDAVWVEQYEPKPPLSQSSTATDPSFEDGQRDKQKPKARFLLLITEWTSQDAEKTVLESGKIEESRGGQVLTAGQYLTKNILQQASAYTHHHVVLENVSASNVQWLDKEEKWSTYVKRLMAEEEQRKNAG